MASSGIPANSRTVRLRQTITLPRSQGFRPETTTPRGPIAACRRHFDGGSGAPEAIREGSRRATRRPERYPAAGYPKPPARRRSAASMPPNVSPASHLATLHPARPSSASTAGVRGYGARVTASPPLWTVRRADTLSRQRRVTGASRGVAASPASDETLHSRPGRTSGKARRAERGRERCARGRLLVAPRSTGAPQKRSGVLGPSSIR
jgi:hypothetical protein